MHIYIYVWENVHIVTHTVYIYTCIYSHGCVFADVFMHCAYIYICIYIYIYVMYVFTYLCMHTYINAHLHTYGPKSVHLSSCIKGLVVARSGRGSRGPASASLVFGSRQILCSRQLEQRVPCNIIETNIFT